MFVCWSLRCRSGRSRRGRNVNRADLSLLISTCLEEANPLTTSAVLFAEARVQLMILFIFRNTVRVVPPPRPRKPIHLALQPHGATRAEQAVHRQTWGRVYSASEAPERSLLIHACVCVCVVALNGAWLNLASEN